MLELKKISKQFGQKKIFDHFNLTIEDGKILSLVGPSGGGKTTLLRMLAGLEKIDSGEIIHNGEVVPIDHLEMLNLLGFVFQDFQLFPHLSVLDNLTLSPVKTMGMTKETAKEKAPVAQSGQNFSGGQKQRLAIARALARKPEIIIFDDSFSALDYKTDRILRSQLKERTADMTKLIVAQRISTIMDADQILVLDEGKVVGQGTHEELLANNDVYREIAYSQLSKEELENGK